MKKLKFKKTIALFLILVMIGMLTVSCGTNETKNKENESSTKQQQEAQTANKEAKDAATQNTTPASIETEKPKLQTENTPPTSTPPTSTPPTSTPPTSKPTTSTPPTSTPATISPTASTASAYPIVEIEMQDGGKMLFELYPQYAPETVKNFLNLASANFYDGLKFHRIIKSFMIQGGDPKGDGSGGASKTIKGEFASNGFTQNTLKHTKGVLSMARSSNPNSASSQFFIMTGNASSLDGKYAAFGKLIEGEAVLDKLAATPIKENPNSGEPSLPKEDVLIKKISVKK